MADGKTKKMRAVRADELPEWCSSDAISTILGKSVRRVQQLTQEGIIHTEQMPGSGQRKYRLTETIKAYMEHLEEQARHKGDASERTKELETRKLEAEVALKESQGELHRMKTAVAHGEYITVEEAQLDLTRFMAQFKKFAMAIPTRMGGIMAGYVDPVEARGMEKDLSKEVAAMLHSFADAAIPEEKAPEELAKIKSKPAPVKSTAKTAAQKKKPNVKTVKQDATRKSTAKKPPKKEAGK